LRVADARWRRGDRQLPLLTILNLRVDLKNLKNAALQRNRRAQSRLLHSGKTHGARIWAIVPAAGWGRGRDRRGEMHDVVSDQVRPPAAAPSFFVAEPQPLELEDFFDNAAVALHIVGPDARILRANKAELELLGYSADEYVGRPISEFHVDRAAIAGILECLSRGERLTRRPALLRAKDGSVRHVEISSSANFRDGEIVNTRCITVDVTELKCAQSRLSEKQHEFRQILEALPAAVYTTDAAGKITYYNRAAVELAGREPEIGKDEWCVTWRLHTLDGMPLPHEQCPMAIAIKENRPVRGVEALAERPDGTLVPFLPFPTPLRDESGQLIGAVNMLVDISGRKSAEAQMKVLLAELNHRVKNNLQMLFSLLQNSRRRAESDDARAVLKDAAQRVAAMAAAQQLLYDARHPHRYQAEDFLKAVLEAARPSFEKTVYITIESADGELTNETAMPLALILNELLTNAVKHGVNGRGTGSIRVGLTCSGETCSLQVEDDGPGFSLDEAGSRSSGLALVAGLARQLNGTFEVMPGPGARCLVRFDNDASPH
jgi:PAS domain S-box-containing protein